MAELSSGVLVKFLHEMDVDGNTLRDREPVLLQVRSIIPVLREGDLWPNQGFFLKVSDLSHALYVSLPQEQDEMVLGNKLHLGQFIYVQKLEAAYPVPMLKGIRTLPGRHPCHGSPKDLLPIHILEKFLGVSNLDSMIDEYNHVIKKKPKEKPQSLSAPKVGSNEGRGGMWGLSQKIEESDNMIMEKPTERSQSLSASKVSSNEVAGRAGVLSWIVETNDVIKKPRERSRSLSALKAGSNEGTDKKALSCRPRKSDVESTLSYRPRRSDAESYDKLLQKYKSRNINKESDMESTISAACRLSVTKRRSWHGREAMAIMDIPVVEDDLKPCDSSPSVSISPLHLPGYDSADDNSSSTKKIRSVISIATESSKFSGKSGIPVSGRISEDSNNQKVTLSSTNDKNFTDNKISWDFLPQTLVKLGQEVLRQRDIALLAAAKALQEASAAERLLNCLSTYSALHSTKGDGQHPSVDQFFSLHDDLAKTTLIVQSLTSISPLGTADIDPNGPHSVREMLKLALDRNKNANSWIRAALAFDLSPVSDYVKNRTGTTEATRAAKRSTKTSSRTKTKGTLIVRKQGNKGELHVGLSSHMDNQPDWVKGSALPISMELANSLKDECRAWFLTYVEDYLEWVSGEITTRQADSQVAEMMYQIKRVNDWLDMRCKDTSPLDDSDSEAYGRVRNKLYGILLKHAERTAMSAMAEC